MTSFNDFSTTTGTSSRSPTIRAYFERLLHGRKERRKIALVATAHYLVRCMHAMLVSGRPWREAA